MPKRVQAALPWIYCVGLVWLNAYLVRHVFSLTYTGATQSMHGYWIALGRVMGDGWLLPQWVPYWAGGMPSELAYAPLIPWLSHHFGLYAILGVVFAIGPTALFLMAWQLSGKPGWAFVAGLTYSLASPTKLFFPDGEFRWMQLLDARRLYVCLIWDEAPHHLALAMVCLAVAAWARGWHRLAIAAIALGALANPYAITGAALFGLCWVVTTGHWRMVAITGALAYLVVCPFYPPSLLHVLRANGPLHHESAWNSRSWLGLAALSAALLLLGWLTRRWTPYRRFAILLALLTSALPVLFYRWHVVILQQPGRYLSEMELALVLFTVFAAERLLTGRPRWLLVALALAGIIFTIGQTIKHRRFSRNSVQQAAPEVSVEYRAAQAASGTVFTVGSLAHWMNVYRDVQQYAGGSFPTTPNKAQQLFTEEMTQASSWERFVLVMRAVGVDGVFLPGRQSPEFWKPFASDVLAGHVPVLWEERDTRLYQIPRTRRTMAHSVPGPLPLEPYVAAMEDPAAPALAVDWPDRNRAVIRGTWRPRDMVLVHTNWHQDWNAYLDGRRVPTRADELGQLVVVPGGNGQLELRFEPGWASRAVAVAALFFVVLWPKRLTCYPACSPAKRSEFGS